MARSHVSAAIPIAMLLVACLGGCAVQAPLACAAGSRAMIEDRLYFGTLRPDGGAPVTEAEWNAFVAETVAAAFPDGFTTWDAEGSWRGADGRTIQEPSHVLMIVRPGAGADAGADAGSAAADAAIADAIAAYRSRFAQESVMQVRSPACVAF